MKKTMFGAIIGMAVVVMSSCVHGGKSETSGKEEAADSIVGDSLLMDYPDHYIEFETLSDKDLWFRVNPSDLKTDLSKRLADAYNASVVQNSIMTDFDMQMRGIDVGEVGDAIKNIDVSVVQDPEVRLKLEAYKKEMLFLLTVNPNDVDQSKHNPWKAKEELYIYLSDKYNIRTFGEIDGEKYWEEYYNCPSVPEWEQLIEKRGEGNMVDELKKRYTKAPDFDARCIYAIELAHAYEADLDSWKYEDGKNPAIPIMETLMREKKYSLYLNELWQKWRVLYQDFKGASKDSEIPNHFYNDYRNLCCCTTLSYIEEHPQDIKAINIFLVLACKENIFREGDYSYGNQNAVEKYYLFPEKYAKYNEETNGTE